VRAPATTIAVDQATASAVISMSSPYAWANRQLAVLGVLGEGRADREEAERQDRHQQGLREVHGDVGSDRIRRQQAGDRGVEGRVAGEEGAQPFARPFAGPGAEGGPDREGAEQKTRTGDQDVVEHGGRELIVTEQSDGQRVAEVPGVDAEHHAHHRSGPGSRQLQDPA
jgi:hypothetical protein